MSWKPLFDALDLAILMWIALMERAALKIDKANHKLYSEFFEQRTRWYASRGKQKAPETLGALSASSELIEIVREDDSAVDS
jgi:hypothetical protein